MRYFRQSPKSWEKEPGQIVTEADIAIDTLLKAELPRGDDAWLSEESTDDRRRLGAEAVWIVDPIDGTRSFHLGRSEFTISVCKYQGGKPVLGIILNPATDELFVSQRGDGVELNGAGVAMRPWLPCSGTKLLVSGREAKSASFDKNLPLCDVKGLGSVAYRLALIAAGRADGLISLRDVADWDIAAGILMVEEAGGVVTDRRGAPLRLNGEPPTHDGLVVASPPLHRELLRQIAGL